MQITYNHQFKSLLEEYELPDDLSFPVTLPPEVQQMLDAAIVQNDLGVTLSTSKGLHKANESWETQSRIENNANHFHLDTILEDEDAKQIFMAGSRTVYLLAKKFADAGIKNVRFHYSFQTPELARQWVKVHNFGNDNEEHYLSDRLSFFSRREGEEMMGIDPKQYYYEALLTIDI